MRYIKSNAKQLELMEAQKLLQDEHKTKLIESQAKNMDQMSKNSEVVAALNSNVEYLIRAKNDLEALLADRDEDVEKLENVRDELHNTIRSLQEESVYQKVLHEDLRSSKNSEISAISTAFEHKVHAAESCNELLAQEINTSKNVRNLIS